MVIQQRRTANQMPMDGSDSQDHQPIRSLEADEQDNYSYPQSLLDRVSSPNDYAVTIAPTPSLSDQPFSCDICVNLRHLREFATNIHRPRYSRLSLFHLFCI